MKMQKRDWYDYLDYLRGQVKNSNLQEPRNVGEAYNNFNVMQDLEDVKYVKLSIARDNAQG